MKKQTERKNKGFTLVEVLVVLFILVSMAGVAVVAYQGVRENAKIDKTRLYIKSLSTALEMYQAHIERFPTTEQGLNALLEAPADLSNPMKWAGPYLKDSAETLDSWGAPYQYICPGQRSRDGFDVWSLGPDGIDGSEDDIGNWSR